MNVNKDSAKSKDIPVADIRPSKSLLAFLEQKIKSTEDLRKNLGTEYDRSTYEKLEQSVTDMRNELKGKLRDIADPNQEYLSRSELRRNFVEDAIQKATKVAENFQEARESNKLNRPKTTDAIEGLSYALKNLRHIIKRSSEK
jgi:hypothetical protein